MVFAPFSLWMLQFDEFLKSNYNLYFLDDELDFLLNKQLSKEDLEDLLFLLKSNVADDRLSQAPVRRFHKRYYNNLDHLARMNFKRSDPALQSLKQQQMSNFRRQQRFSNLNTRHMLGGL